MLSTETDRKELQISPLTATNEEVIQLCDAEKKNNEYNYVIIDGFRFRSCGPKSVLLAFPKRIDEGGFTQGDLSQDEKTLTFRNRNGDSLSVTPLVIDRVQEKLIRDNLSIIPHPFVPIFNS